MGRALTLCLLLAGWATGARAADFELTQAETARVNRGEMVIRADLDAAQRSGTVRAALLIDAPPAVVFHAMTRCEDALEYVPHLRHCRVLPEPGPSGSHLVEHEIDFGWYAPRIRYVFRADVVADRSIAFRQVRGDFKANEGIWEFESKDGGSGHAERTLVRYRVAIDPPGYVPNWLARSTFRRELPQMLIGLKRHCEAEQRAMDPGKQSSLRTPHLD